MRSFYGGSASAGCTRVFGTRGGLTRRRRVKDGITVRHRRRPSGWQSQRGFPDYRHPAAGPAVRSSVSEEDRRYAILPPAGSSAD